MSKTVQAYLKDGISRLKDSGVETALLDARYLLAHALDMPRDRLSLSLQESMSESSARHFMDLIEARCRFVPVSHLIGMRLFHGHKFKVTSDVLDPRPETEILVEEALKAPFQTCLDLGTGSGCIVISLLIAQKNARAVATDLSSKALEIASHNAKALDVDARLTLLNGSWLSPLTKDQKFDLIVSNPPYITPEELEDLSKDVKDHEPHLALTDGVDGLQCYKEICHDVCNHLNDGGRVLFEIGEAQAQDVSQIMRENGLENIQLIKDFDGKDRVLVGSYHPNVTNH